MRQAALEDFLRASEAALTRCTGPARAVADEVVRRWQGEGTARPGAVTLPACDWIAPALAATDAPLARAFAALVPQLGWKRRASADPVDVTFWNGHANALILGPGGLEDRADLWVGATVMAPGVTYVDHDHPPAEIYIPLSPGEWWNARMDWTDPGEGGFIFNPPGILHAMRSGGKPFLALWYLPV